MFKFIMPTILIVIAGATFFTFTQPLYKEIISLRLNVAAYDEALSNSKALESERDKLVKDYNAISGDNLKKLEKLLPESIDNIRLILEIQTLATRYGMSLRDVKYDTTKEEKAVVNPGAILGGTVAKNANQDYGIWDLEFSTSGTYDNFISFVKDIENNLRIVDIASVVFSSSTNTGSNPNIYKYDFKIKTYWLKK